MAQQGLDADDAARGAGAGADVRVIAFYLSQFHPIPESDRWWGEGFTEWTNVRKARPNFLGHYQPHVPGELGYYDLRDADAQDAQATLARAHGIHGFCYYYYWFNGQRLLERPLEAMLDSGRPDFPFCLCWANENWTRRWDGLDQEILLAQRYSREDSLAFIRDLLPVFADRRYIRVDGRPLLVIYKPDAIPDLAATVALWRDEARQAGSGELYLAAALASWQDNPTTFGFDAAVEFPPHGHAATSVAYSCDFINPDFAGRVVSYRSYVAQLLTRPRPDFKLFRTLLPAWDNTPNRQNTGTIFVGSSPEIFGWWLERVVRQTRLRLQGDERLVFINAWNEWGEGCHLEPDLRCGRQYLQAISAALAAAPPSTPERPPWDVVRARANSGAASARTVRLPAAAAPAVGCGTRVSVVMAAYNHERFVRASLDSIIAQTYANLEIIVVDDGSSDATGDVLDDYAARCTTHQVTVVHQPNVGAPDAFNHGLSLAHGDVIALANSDDRYTPARIETMLAAMQAADAGFAFSDVRFIDFEGAEIVSDHEYVEQLRYTVGEALRAPDPLFMLVRCNFAMTTGNFVFRRELLEHIGGFSAFRVCHDWDFILAATYHTRLAFVDRPQYEFRLHGKNTFGGLRLRGNHESDEVLVRFFAGVARHPIMRERASADAFLAHCRSNGLAGYLSGNVAPRVSSR